MALSVNWTMFVANSLVQLVTHSCLKSVKPFHDILAKNLFSANSFCVLSWLFVFKSLIRAFIIKSCRNLNKNMRLRQVSGLKIVVISYFFILSVPFLRNLPLLLSFFVATKLIDDGESYNTLL